MYVIYEAKKKVLMTCAFVFAYGKSRFFCDAAKMVSQNVQRGQIILYLFIFRLLVLRRKNPQWNLLLVQQDTRHLGQCDGISIKLYMNSQVFEMNGTQL